MRHCKLLLSSVRHSSFSLILNETFQAVLYSGVRHSKLVFIYKAKFQASSSWIINEPYTKSLWHGTKFCLFVRKSILCVFLVFALYECHETFPKDWTTTHDRYSCDNFWDSCWWKIARMLRMLTAIKHNCHLLKGQ
jgi:hypothetical protein